MIYFLIQISNFKDKNKYEIRIFDTPLVLHNAIKAKAAKDETQLSRVIATYDWKYIDGKSAPSTQKYWQVNINGWTLPWNEQLFHVDIKKTLNNRQNHRYSTLDWAEKDYTINEAGSTFTIQGFDLTYAGVILGPSIKFNKSTGKIWFDEDKRSWDKMKGNRTFQDGTIVNVTNIISQHELRVLMTRGTKGLYIYTCDDDLRNELKKRIKIR